MQRPRNLWERELENETVSGAGFVTRKPETTQIQKYQKNFWRLRFSYAWLVSGCKLGTFSLSNGLVCSVSIPQSAHSENRRS